MRWSHWVFVAVPFFVSMSADAATNATVSSDSAIVRSQPDASSEPLETLSKGTVVRVGDRGQNGWRRGAVPAGANKGKIGWIEEVVLSFEAAPPTPTAAETVSAAGGSQSSPAPARRKKSSVWLGVGGGMAFFTGVSGIDIGVGAGYFFSRSFGTLLRYSSVQTPASGDLVAISASYLSLMAEWVFWRPKHWAFSLSAGPAMVLPSAVSQAGFGGEGALSISFFIGSKFFLRAEGGFRATTFQVSDASVQAQAALMNGSGIGMIGLDL